jgi:rhomboid family GlyGly-CTERM serine protease
MNTAVTAFADTAARRKTKESTHLNQHWPLWIWALLLIAVNMPLLWGQVRTGLLYLPEAVDNGQWWRVITFPLVHLSWYHLLLDAGGFLLLFSCLEEQRPLAKAIYIIGPGAGTLFLASVLDPSISQRGLSGLSGIAHGLMAVSALEMLGHKDHRTWGGLSLAVVVIKSAYELWSGRVLFEFMHMGLCGHPLAASHAGGVMGGVLAFLLLKGASRMLCRTRRSSSSTGQNILRKEA